MGDGSPMLRAALWYADLDYPVLPCAPGRKTPLTRHGLHDATTDAEQIERWWAEHPDANVAIRTDGLVVIDIDGPDNPWLADQPQRRSKLEWAPTSLTPRGGRQHLFRQPAGRRWRNTESRLARHVDTRADGGYVVVPPSRCNGRCYRWLDDQDLSLSAEGLPEPPAWLTEALDAVSNGAAREAPGDGNSIPEGQRNAALARLAGAMRRVGMTRDEILAALNRVNVDRCRPPLDAREVARIADSIARYEPDAVSVALVEDHFAQDFSAPPATEPQTVQQLLRNCPTLRAPVIVGLLRRGETMNVIAPPKTGKSWLVLGLAMAVATGRRWLDAFETVPGPVLIIDNELHAETLAHRIPQVAEALGVGLDEIAETICVQSLRGQLRDIFSMRQYFESIEPGRYALVVLDAFYRFMPRDMDENDNGTMAGLYNHIDALADRLGCSFVLIHHTTKGNQSAKAVTDVGAGAGSQSRATDTHLVMRPHEEPHAVVLDAAVRSWPPIEPLVLRWTFPVWTPTSDLDPTALRNEKPRRSKSAAATTKEPATPSWDYVSFVETFVGPTPRSLTRILHDAELADLSDRRARRFLQLAEEERLVFRWRGRAHEAVYYATTAPPEQSQSNRSTKGDPKREAVESLLRDEPGLSSKEIAKRCGVSRQYVHQLRAKRNKREL